MTVLLALLAAAALQIDAVSRWLIYDRSLILQGEVWRAWTGHVVHFGRSHFIWNLAVFVPAGVWSERLWPVLTRWFYVSCPLVISVALLGLDPTLDRYAGLSGLATGLLVLLALLQLGRRNEEPAWFWISVLVLVGAKIGTELFTGAPVFVSGFGDIRTVPAAHIFGALCGISFAAGAAAARRSSKRRV